MTDPPPDRAKGNAIPRRVRDIDRLSEVTLKDIARARTSWKTRAPVPYKGLIDAMSEKDGDVT
jgi:hypothetical protein